MEKAGGKTQESGPRRLQVAHASMLPLQAAREKKGIGRQALGGRSMRLDGRLAQDWLGITARWYYLCSTQFARLLYQHPSSVEV